NIGRRMLTDHGLFLPSVMKGGCSSCPLIEISPSLRHVIFVIQRHRQTRIVPVVWRFHSRHSSQSKCDTLLKVIRDTCDHLRLVTGNTVVCRNQLVTIQGDILDHGRLVTWTSYAHLY